MDRMEAVLGRLPRHAYNPEDKSSALYKLIKSIIDEFNITMNNIDRINNMIGINTALPEDIYDRFGALLNIKRNSNETDEQYKSRLKVSVTSLSGGTIDAIKYAIASGLGINNDNTAMDRIHVYDAWEYPGTANVDTGYGNVVCEIDLNQGQYSVDMEKIVADSANDVKAAGVNIQFVYYNFRIMYYAELDDVTYLSLGTLTYSQVGE